jgi:hypothetical protein
VLSERRRQQEPPEPVPKGQPPPLVEQAVASSLALVQERGLPQVRVPAQALPQASKRVPQSWVEKRA